MIISAESSADLLAGQSPSGPSSPRPMIDNHGLSAMTRPLLILGGTTEAAALSQKVASAGINATLSLAGRVKAPAEHPLPTRVGGFGGADGLAAYLRAHSVRAVIDATHPFAAQMSRNAVAACARVNVPLMALSRAPWQETACDQWEHVPDIQSAAQRLNGEPKRVFLAVGRQHLREFARNIQHFYLLRVVDGLDAPPFPNCEIITARGPFSADADEALLQSHRIEVVVSKNSGGSGAEAKIIAARRLGLPVIMIDRPALPQRQMMHSVDAAMHWIDHIVADLGV